MNELLKYDNEFADLLTTTYNACKGLYKKEKTPKALQTKLNKISKTLNLEDNVQAILVCIFYTNKIEEIKTTDKFLADFLDCKVSELGLIKNTINLMYFKGLVDKVKSSSYESFSHKYELANSFQTAILFNTIEEYFKGLQVTNILSFFNHINIITNSLVTLLKEEGNVNVESYYEYYIGSFNRALNSIKNENFVKKINKINYPNDYCKFILTYLMYCYVFQGMNAFNISNLINTMFPPGDLYTIIRNFFTSKGSVLSQLGYIEPIKSDYNNGQIKLGKAFIENFVSNDKAFLEFIPEPDVESSDLIKPINIKTRNLFYNAEEEDKVSILKKAFQEDEFTNLKERLKDSGFEEGITVLFHGFPGTGKTETVMQIAKETGRSVFHVDFSQLKDMYVGNSEKNVKAVFENYYSYVEKTQSVPILLFNEADSIISKRTGDVRNSTDQMSNTIQNILLEELEKFKGIMIATTNLITNIDKAFDRRFLYKVNFNKPNEENRGKIWKSRNKWLKKSECTKLAKEFDFTGGQIENVTKKYVIDSALKGQRNDVNILIKYCKEEEFRKQNKKITKQFNGFN